MEQLTDPFKVSEKPVCSIKFIAKKQWILAGTVDGYIHVYNYACVTDMKKIRSIFAQTDKVHSLAVHPIQPYLLSACKTIKLWDMDEEWQCTQTLKEHMAGPIAFHPQDASSFATTSGNKVKVWGFGDLKPSYSLYQSTFRVRCLDFFTRDDGLYLITGLDDSTAKIWDIQERKCIHTMEDILSPVISVISLPSRPYLVTGSKDGVVHVWSSIDFRLQETVNFAGGGPVLGLAYLKDSRSVVIGQEKMISTMNINDQDMISDNEELIINEEEVTSNNNEDIINDKEETADNENVIIDDKKAVDSHNNSTISHQNFTTAQTGTSTSYRRKFMGKIRKTFNISKR